MLVFPDKSNQQIMALGEDNIMMVLPFHQNDDRVPIEHTQPDRKIRLVNPEAGMDPTRRNDYCPADGRLLECGHVNGFISLPRSLYNCWG